MSDGLNTPIELIIIAFVHVEFCGSSALNGERRIACVNCVVFSIRSTSL